MDAPATTPAPPPVATAQVSSPPPQDRYVLDASIFDINAMSPQTPPPPPPASASPPPPPPAPPPEEHSPRLLNLARQVGLTQQEIDATPPGKLHGVLQEIALEQQLLRPANEPPPAAKPEPVGFEAMKADDYDPHLYSVLKANHEELSALRKQNSEYGEALKMLSAAEGRRQSESAARKADEFFVAHKEIYGEKRFHELDKADPNYVKRATVMQMSRALKIDQAAAHRILYGEATQGVPAPAAPSAAAVPVKAPQPQDPATGKFVPRVSPEQWAAAGTAMPTQRAGAIDPPGDQRAIKAVELALRDNQEISANGRHVDVATEFPD